MSRRVGLVLLVAVASAGCGGSGGGAGSTLPSMEGSVPTWSETIPSTEVASTDAPVVTASPDTLPPATTEAAPSLPPVSLIDLAAPGAISGVSELLSPVNEIVAGNIFEAPVWAVKDSQVYEVRRSASPNYADPSGHTVIDKIAVVTDAPGDNESILNAVAADVSAAVGLHVSEPVTEDRDGVSITIAVVGDYGTEVLVTVAVSTIPDTEFHAVSIERQANVPGAFVQPAQIVEFVSTEAPALVAATPDTVMTGWDFEDGLNMFDGAPQHSRTVIYRTGNDYASVMSGLVAVLPGWDVSDDSTFGYFSSPDNSTSIAVAPSGDGGVNITVAVTG